MNPTTYFCKKQSWNNGTAYMFCSYLTIRRQIDITTYQLLFFLSDTSLCLFGDEFIQLFFARAFSVCSVSVFNLISMFLMHLRALSCICCTTGWVTRVLLMAVKAFWKKKYCSWGSSVLFIIFRYMSPLASIWNHQTKTGPISFL